MFTEAWVESLVNELNEQVAIDKAAFLHSVFSEEWEELELKDRCKHIAGRFADFLPGNYPKQLEILKKVAPKFNGFRAIVFSDFVELYGLSNWDESIQALEIFTQACTAEFAVRPFLLKDFDRMIPQFKKWSLSNNEHIRRLSSEGIRPKLPWGKGVPRLNQETDTILSILQNLILDPSEYVRRSVANNLNDLSKDHPDRVIKFIGDLDLTVTNTNKLAKHALRTLLKKGNKEAMQFFGFTDSIQLKNSKVRIASPEVKIGENLHWNFTALALGEGNLRLEYKVHFHRPSGQASSKVFQLKELVISGECPLSIGKKHSFKNFTTRTHYPGIHRLELIANGNSVCTEEFEVVN